MMSRKINPYSTSMNVCDVVTDEGSRKEENLNVNHLLGSYLQSEAELLRWQFPNELIF
jgi:hypothetical protein